MKPLVLAVCVTASTLAWARERKPMDLRVTIAAPRSAAFDPPPPTSVAAATVDDRARGAQDRVVSALESAQHLGSRDATFFWVTPSFGLINGATFRFDFR
jgi:hypothetical protein